jgi:uncharacterized repeat protein (TIGR01451 family)
MSKTRGLLVGLLVVAAFAAVTFSATVINRGAEAAHTPGDTMSIRHSGGDPGPFGGGTILAVPVGGMFNAEIWADTSSANGQGYQWEIAYDPVYLTATGTNTELQSGTFSLCAPAAGVPFGPFIIYGQGAGCLAPGAPQPLAGQLTNIQMQCIAATSAPPGATAIAMIAADPVEDALTDPVFGSSYIDPGGVLRPTSTRFKGPNPAGGTIAQIVVACVSPIDIAIDKAGPATAAVGGSGTYVLTISNSHTSPVNVDVSDAAPVGTTFTSIDNGPACTFLPASATCTALSVPAGGNVVVNIGVTFDTCGQKSNAASVQVSSGQAVVDVNPANNSDGAVTQVDCANLTVTKTGPATATVGDVAAYNIQICNDAGGTAAANVVVGDVPSGGTATYGAPVPPGFASIASGACVNSTVAVTFTDAGNVCNTASATQDAATGGPSNNSQACTTVAPSNPTKGMIDPADANPTGNIWLCKPLGGAPAGDPTQTCGTGTISELIQAPLDVDTCNDDDNGDGRGCNRDIGPDGICGTADDVSNSSDWDGDMGDLQLCPVGDEPGEGLGAFEFQIKFDHKLFQHPSVDCQTDSDLDGNADSVLDDTGRVIRTTVDVITENWILIGCVTKPDADGDGIPGEPGDSPDPGPDVTAISTMVNITWHVQPDLLERIRPTKDNGVRADLLDENCEAADTLGSPFNMEVEPNGSNNAPNGGLADNCTDVTFTIRMLEGDIDLDCDVDVVDDQTIAFRYGATFGVLTYDPFFDLEPNTTPTDFDVDIKDLQFVFGRNGSTCTAPIPPQNPQPPVPDP